MLFCWCLSAGDTLKFIFQRALWLQKKDGPGRVSAAVITGRLVGAWTRAAEKLDCYEFKSSHSTTVSKKKKKILCRKVWKRKKNVIKT